jgi:hypothetical protein
MTKIILLNKMDIFSGPADLKVILKITRFSRENNSTPIINS